jgi:signal transduction histidine kinase
MRAGGSARPVMVRTPGPIRAGLWLAAVAAVAAFGFALYSGTTTIERVAVVVAAGLGVVAAVGLTAAYQRRRAVRALAASAAEVTAGGPRRLTDDAELAPVTTLINRMADDAAQTLAALRGERDLSGSVLDSMTQGVIALDRELRITLINPAARRIFALPGVPIGERFVDQIAVAEAIELVTAARADGAAEFTTAAGVRAAARVTPQRSGDGRLLVVDDVTAIRRLETIRADFIANVSHELRTPVAVIRANAEILQSGGKDDPAFAGRLIDGLHRNAERLARIIGDLLDLSRLGRRAVPARAVRGPPRRRRRPGHHRHRGPGQRPRHHGGQRGPARPGGDRRRQGPRSGPGQPDRQRHQVLAGRRSGDGQRPPGGRHAAGRGGRRRPRHPGGPP